MNFPPTILSLKLSSSINLKNVFKEQYTSRRLERTAKSKRRKLATDRRRNQRKIGQRKTEMQEDIGNSINILMEILKAVANENTQIRVHINRDHNLSSKLENSFEERQQLENEQTYEEAKEHIKNPRRKMQEERLQHKRSCLEDELWFDIRKAEKGFVPNHTKIQHPDGSIATSDARPTILSDHYEKTQWGKTRDKQEAPKRPTSTLNNHQ